MTRCHAHARCAGRTHGSHSGEAMISRIAMVGVQVAEEAIIDSAHRPPLPPLTRDSVLIVVGADTDHGRERVAQYAARCLIVLDVFGFE